MKFCTIFAIAYNNLTFEIVSLVSVNNEVIVFIESQPRWNSSDGTLSNDVDVWLAKVAFGLNYVL